MREVRHIVEKWRQGFGSVLVSLVKVRGSSYRQPGARLMVCRDGSYEGSISAGCLEADILRKAAWLTRDGAAVERYSTFSEDPADMPFGLGCGGVLDLLLEPVEAPEGQALLMALESTLAGQDHLVVTWLPQPDRGLMRAVFRKTGEVTFFSKGISAQVLSEVWSKCLSIKHPALTGAFVESLTPPQRITVFGAGDDAKPLVSMAWQLGWNVTVVDGRANLACKSRFPESDVEVVSTCSSVLRRIGPRDAAVIMTHSYEQDRNFLIALLPLRPAYVGLLGSRARSASLIADAAATLELSIAECCDLVSAPAGLNIGGEGPESIALSILAEAHASCMGNRDETRKLSEERVHYYLATPDCQSYAATQCALGAV